MNMKIFNWTDKTLAILPLSNNHVSVVITLNTSKLNSILDLTDTDFSLTRPPYVAFDIKSRRHEICFKYLAQVLLYLFLIPLKYGLIWRFEVWLKGQTPPQNPELG